MNFSEFFNHFTEYYGMGNSLLFRRIPLSQLAYFQFPVISNKEKFVLALVINIIFPVIYVYDDNPLFSTFKNTSVFCFHGAKCSQRGQRRKQLMKACNEVKGENKYQRESSRC